jgi:hypothetical protein
MSNIHEIYSCPVTKQTYTIDVSWQEDWYNDETEIRDPRVLVVNDDTGHTIYEDSSLVYEIYPRTIDSILDYLRHVALVLPPDVSELKDRVAQADLQVTKAMVRRTQALEVLTAHLAWMASPHAAGLGIEDLWKPLADRADGVRYTTQVLNNAQRDREIAMSRYNKALKLSPHATAIAHIINP